MPLHPDLTSQFPAHIPLELWEVPSELATLLKSGQSTPIRKAVVAMTVRSWESTRENISISSSYLPFILNETCQQGDSLGGSDIQEGQ